MTHVRPQVALLFGGSSPEANVSIKSATAVANWLDPGKYQLFPVYIDRDGAWYWAPEWPKYDIRASNCRKIPVLFSQASATSDGACKAYSLIDPSRPEIVGTIQIVFPVLHGTYGEDGCVQGYLETLKVPYVGSGVTASALAFNKKLMKTRFLALDLPVPKYLAISRNEWMATSEEIKCEVQRRLPPPWFVKPTSSGSSIGITRVTSFVELHRAIEHAFTIDEAVLVEEGILNSREVEVGVLATPLPTASAPGEVLYNGEYYDQFSKYNGSIVNQVPAQISDSLSSRLRDIACAVFADFRCRDFARIDFLVTRDSGDVYILEINTMPGLTKDSMFPHLLGASAQLKEAFFSQIIDSKLSALKK